MTPRFGWRCITAGRHEPRQRPTHQIRLFPPLAYTLLEQGPCEPGHLDASLTLGGLWHGEADRGSWFCLWLACVYPISQRSGALVWRHGVWRSWSLRTGFLRLWVWHGLFAVWLRERSLLRCVPAGPIRLSGSHSACLCREAGRLRRRCTSVCSEASRQGAVESGLPSRVAKRLVSGSVRETPAGRLKTQRTTVQRCRPPLIVDQRLLYTAR